MTFGLVKHNNNSISAVTSVGLTQGKMTLIKEQTASSSSSISFVHGSSSVVFDSTYPIYMFSWINLHSSNDDVFLEFNLSTDSGSNYNVTKTTSLFRNYHFENASTQALAYEAEHDLAQSTSDQRLAQGLGNVNDESSCGNLFIFQPSDTTFVKHFMSVSQTNHGSADASYGWYVGGYGNTQSAINGVKFDLSAGTLDSGTIKLYGIKGT